MVLKRNSSIRGLVIYLGGKSGFLGVKKGCDFRGEKKFV